MRNFWLELKEIKNNKSELESLFKSIDAELPDIYQNFDIDWNEYVELPKTIDFDILKNKIFEGLSVPKKLLEASNGLAWAQLP